MYLLDIDITDELNLEYYINCLFYLGKLNYYNNIYLKTNIDIQKYLPTSYKNYNIDIVFEKKIKLTTNYYITNDIYELFQIDNIDVLDKDKLDENIIKINPDRYGNQYISYFENILNSRINLYLDNLNIRRYTNIIEKSKNIIDNLMDIVNNSNEKIEGNCFTEDKSGRVLKELVLKQVNIYNMGQISTNILEIGFNAGHSALLLLLGNPHSKIHIFDILYHSYTLDCFNYLKKIFGDRLVLHNGDSNIVIPQFECENPNIKFDLVHIDGCHLKEIAEKDFYNTYKILLNGGIIMWDDSNKNHLFDLQEKFIQDNMVRLKNKLPTFTYNHEIFIKN